MTFGLQAVSALCSPTVVFLSIRVLILLKVAVGIPPDHVSTIRHVLMSSHLKVLEVLSAADECDRDSV